MNYKNSITTKIPQGNDFTLRVELTEYVKLKGKTSERKVTFKDGTTPTVNIYYQNGRIIKNQFDVSFEEGNHTLLISFIEQGGTNVLAVGKYAIEIKGKRNEDNSDFRWYLPIGKAFNIVYSSLDGYFPSDSITTYSINGVVGIAQSINSIGGIFQQVQTNWLQEDNTAIDYIKNKPNLSQYITSASLEALLNNKQNTLISGTSIKTINNQSILGSGNLTIAGGSGITSYNQLTDTPDLTQFLTTSDLEGFVKSSDLSGALATKQNTLQSGINIKTINNQSLLITGENDSTDITIGGGPNTQSNWTESDSSSPAYIQNKPTIPTVESLTPTIQNGYWYVGTEPTNVKATGDNGTNGTNGAPGDNAYVHIKYSNDGGQTISGSQGQGGSYLGIYTDNDRSDSQTPTYYTWSKIKGEDGTGISSIIINYASSSSGTTAPSSSWGSTIPTVVPGDYLWTKIEISYTDNRQSTIAYSVARQGVNGQNGQGGGSSQMTITTDPPVSNNTLQAGSNILYRFTTLVSALTIQLQQPSSSSVAVEYLFRFKTASSGVNIAFTDYQGSTTDILYPFDYVINTNTEYEISVLYDGSKYLVSNCAYQ